MFLNLFRIRASMRRKQLGSLILPKWAGDLKLPVLDDKQCNVNNKSSDANLLRADGNSAQAS